MIPVKRIFKWIGIAVAVVFALLLLALLLLNTHRVQEGISRHATQLLSERLQTRVEVDDARVEVFRGDVTLCGVMIEDQQGREMFRLQRLSVGVSLIPLLRSEVRVRQLRVQGLNAMLVTPPMEEKANFQFLIDSLKPKQNKEPKKKHRLQLEAEDVFLQDVRLSWNQKEFRLASLSYETDLWGRWSAEVSGLEAQWTGHNKRGPMDCKALVNTIEVSEQDDAIFTTLDGIHYVSDNHRPRKNAGKPKKGFFNVGHLDLKGTINLTIDSIGPQYASVRVTDVSLKDDVTGIDVHDLHFKLMAQRSSLLMEQFSLMQGSTTIRFDSARVTLPNKESGQPLRYSTSPIFGTVYLKDIARPFARVLRTFSMPLQLKARMEGEGDRMQFPEVHVWTSDQRLDVRARGGIEHLRDKNSRLVHFDINKMQTTGRKAMQVIDQLAIKKFMLKQLEALGNITFTGRMDIPRKKEHFRGVVTTGVGAMDLDLRIDGWTKYVSGRVRTDSLLLGKVINMPAIGKLACTADFRFDISKERTARMRRRVGGKLPMGELHADVPEASYKKIKIRHLSAELHSDGAKAQGNVAVHGGRVDLLCAFYFTNTDSIHKMKIKPGVSFHKLTEEKKQERTEKRQQEKEKQSQLRADKKQKRKEKREARKAKRAGLKSDS